MSNCRPPYIVKVPAKNARNPTGDAISVPCHMLLPHQLFSYLCTRCPKLLHAATNGGDLQGFWAKALESRDPHFVGHRLLDVAGWQGKAVPMTIYGDGARFARIDSLELVTMSFLLVKEATWISKCVLAAFVKTAETKPQTWTTIWAILKWSFECMFTGKHPPTDHTGSPWPEGSWGAKLAGQDLCPQGRIGVIHRITGDLDWYHGRLGLGVAPGANNPCCWCLGGRPGHGPPFLHLEPTAAWVPTCFVPPQPTPSPLPVWQVPGLSRFSVAIDAMHTGDLGVLAHFLGGCFHTFLFEGHLAGTLEQRESTLWDRVRRLYREHGSSTRVTRLARNLWCDPTKPHRTFPCMITKAAENKHLLPIVCQLCQDLNSGSARDQTRLDAAIHLMRLYETFDTAGHFLTHEQHRRAVDAMWNFFLAYQHLNMESAARKAKVWNIVNKFHFFAHMVLASKHLNPFSVWTYPSEDLMGRMKKLAVASKDGLQAAMLSKPIFLKYKKVLHLALKKHEGH